VSARHIHLSREDMDILFGKGSDLTPQKDLMGGQFAAKETVTIIGLKLRAIENVRVLGPLRKQTQVEVSATDCIRLGVKAPVRLSGDLKGSAPITIIGPKGAVTIQEGCIVALRHIHMSPADAAAYGVKDKQVVRVQMGGERGGYLDNVPVRVDPSFTTEMHIDTDEANALGIHNGMELNIVI
ncbi:MAG: phosphate propanoyltransferase, partial [Firmicutes bacterium]|nr:phosphate propanoyltransferase [Bacillota bacterium]